MGLNKIEGREPGVWYINIEDGEPGVGCINIGDGEPEVGCINIGDGEPRVGCIKIVWVGKEGILYFNVYKDRNGSRSFEVSSKR